MLATTAEEIRATVLRVLGEIALRIGRRLRASIRRGRHPVVSLVSNLSYRRSLRANHRASHQFTLAQEARGRRRRSGSRPGPAGRPALDRPLAPRPVRVRAGGQVLKLTCEVNRGGDDASDLAKLRLKPTSNNKTSERSG
jgi:hypothetical protein